MADSTIQVLKEFKRIAKARAEANNESHKLFTSYSHPDIYFRDQVWFELCRFHTVFESKESFMFRVAPKHVSSIYQTYKELVKSDRKDDQFDVKFVQLDGFDIVKLMREYENRIDIELYDNLISIEQRESGSIRAVMNYIDPNLYDKFMLKINNTRGPLLNNVDRILTSIKIHQDDDQLRSMLYDLSYLSLINKLDIDEDKLEMYKVNIDDSSTRRFLHYIPNAINKVLSYDDVFPDYDHQIYDDLIGLTRCENTLAAITGWEEMSPMLFRPDLKIVIDTNGSKQE